MRPNRKLNKKVMVGSVPVGGGERIAIQSMTNSDTCDFEATLAQIRTLENAGCDIVRFTVPDREAVRNVFRLKDNSRVPLVADIHFDYRLAVEAAYAGIDKIRINPGNIGGKENVRAVVRACREKNIPIRVGVNSGSLEREYYAKYGGPVPEALCESALAKVRMLEEFDFTDIVVSVKSSDVVQMIRTNRLLAERCDYPIHLGVTESGTVRSGELRSAVGIGSLLSDGIGDTIRVSLTTNDLTEEVRSARRILSACNLIEDSVKVISCPTCGRTKIDIVSIAAELEDQLEKMDLHPRRPVKVAVMGCVVNGPGEARECDVGIAGGKGEAMLFRKGEICGKIPEDNILPTLIGEVEKIVKGTYDEESR